MISRMRYGGSRPEQGVDDDAGQDEQADGCQAGSRYRPMRTTSARRELDAFRRVSEEVRMPADHRPSLLHRVPRTGVNSRRIHRRGASMNRLTFVVTAGMLVAGMATARAADNWVGAWGYVTSPAPPGETPVVIVPAAARLSALMPLSVPPEPAARAAFMPGAPLLENPGGLSILPGNIDLTNVTVRQLVRVSAAGSRDPPAVVQ